MKLLKIIRESILLTFSKDNKTISRDMSIIFAPFALGIGAASFASGASKDIAESPTAERSGAGTPK